MLSNIPLAAYITICLFIYLWKDSLFDSKFGNYGYAAINAYMQIFVWLSAFSSFR